MRIRTANGVGFVRLVMALVIATVVVSGNAFGQQKQSGKANSSRKKVGVVPELRIITPIPDIRIMTDPPHYTLPEVPVYGYNDPQPAPSGTSGGGWYYNPNVITPPSPPNSPNSPGMSGVSLPGNVGSSGTASSDPPIMQERCISCSCNSDHAGPEFPDPNCNGAHLYHLEWVYTHSYDACAQSEHTDLHICQSGRIEEWKFNATKYRFSNCSGVPDQNEPVFKQGNNATGLTHSAAGVDFPLCRQ